MNVLQVSAELAPLAKTGGLGDAVAGLSSALAARGHDLRVLLPGYGNLVRSSAALATVTDPASGRRYVEVRAELGGARVYLLDAPTLFGDEQIYFGDERDAARFFEFTEAALGFGEALDWRADLVHCHDWHAALVPVLGTERAEPLPSVLTLHNIGYQGVFPSALVDLERHASLEPYVDAAAAPPLINFLRAGVQAADLLTTVSPTYAREIQTAAYGMGLEDLLRARSEALVGILNGVDYSLWDPGIDPYLEPHYGPADPAPKRRVKQMLCETLGLDCGPEDPLIGVVTRLVPQKGIDLVAAIVPALMERSRGRFAILGSGESWLEQDLARIAQEAPGRVAFTRGYDEALAHQILAGSDIVLLPSRYEPCGLTQLYALRYGTIPVVRATGGLADTVAHFDPSTGAGNGSVFNDADPEGLAWGVDQALGWFSDRALWSRLIANAMAADFSWAHQVEAYLALYRRVLEDY